MWLVSLSLLISALCDISAGNDFANCKEFQAIKNESMYDRSPSSANDPSKRPLGFWYTTIPFVTNNADAKNPCFQLSLDNSSSQTVEVLAHSAVGSSSFCVKSEPPYAQPTCQSGIKTCQDSPIGHDSIKYVFYCDGCETDLQIWIRLTVSPSFTNGLDFEYWCQREAEYPSSLVTLPNPPEITEEPTSSACLVSQTFLWILFVSFASLQVHSAL